MNTLLRHTMAPVALLALALPVLTGCRQDSVRGVEDPDHAVRSTVLGLRATSTLPTGGVRDVTEEQTDVAPAKDTGEGEITYIQVSLPQLNFLQKTTPDPDSNNGEYTGYFQIPLLQSVTTPYAVLIGSQDLGLATTDFTPDKTVGSDRFLDLIHADGFVQTTKSSEGSTTIEPGVTDPTAENRNIVSVEVERVVGKLQIAQKDGLSLTLPSVGTFSPLTYSMAGSAKETYLFRDHAGSRTLVDKPGQNAVYEGFKSVIDDETVPPDGWDPKAGHPFLRRVSDKEGGDYVLGGYYRNPKKVTTATATATSINGGFYFYENSMYGGTKVAAKKGEIKYNRIAYAKVYTKLTPSHAYKTKYVSGSYERELVKPEEFTEEQSYQLEISKELYYKLKGDPTYADRLTTGWTSKPGGAGYQSYDLSVTDKPGTFYEGVEDGVLYLRLRDAVLMGNKSVRKYDEGRMVYLLPLNRQLDATKKFVNYCDTRRNNIYDITIDGIDAIGHNYDPVDPDDPNVPKPEDNPFEPPTDPQIPVEEPDYLMRITAKVIKWNLVEKHYALWE